MDLGHLFSELITATCHVAFVMDIKTKQSNSSPICVNVCTAMK